MNYNSKGFSQRESCCMWLLSLDIGRHKIHFLNLSSGCCAFSNWWCNMILFKKNLCYCNSFSPPFDVFAWINSNFFRNGCKWSDINYSIYSALSLKVKNIYSSPRITGKTILSRSANFLLPCNDIIRGETKIEATARRCGWMAGTKVNSNNPGPPVLLL